MPAAMIPWMAASMLLLQPREQVRQARADAVDVERGQLQGLLLPRHPASSSPVGTFPRRVSPPVTYACVQGRAQPGAGGPCTWLTPTSQSTTPRPPQRATSLPNGRA